VDALPTFRDIWLARQRISRFVQETPLVLSQELSKRFAASVYLKLEYLQPTGSFKLRGAANKILSLTPQDRQRGVATFSTGNHGLAVAYMAKELGVPASVFISSRVPEVKVNNLKALGVDVVVHGASQDDAEENCYRVAEEKGLTVIKPFDDPFVLAGQGTIALELLKQCPQMDETIIPLSGGGLAAGVALGLKATDQQIRVTGVSMEKGAVMYESLKAGKPVVLPESDTLADSLLGGIGLDNKYTFPLVRDCVDEVVCVSEVAIAQGMAFLYKHQLMVVEGASATTVSALLERSITKEGSHIVLLLTGNNVDPQAFLSAVSGHL
jgi:threonine dehydratase